MFNRKDVVTVVGESVEERFKVIFSDEDSTFVWADADCIEPIMFPTNALELSQEKIVDGQYAYVTFKVKTDEQGFIVSRDIDAVGLDSLVAAYADLRQYIGGISDISIEEIDALIADSNGGVQ